ncbi:MAG: DUF2949 domain-containing protein [Synechococcales cyanobacterium RU_4_20]|nr:DUF2949 domain-containing protein [Synechococcales cyanobacterium RU_4_20]NJR69893.1 DUF2949 domain-containing protein [Synechococcales cyanobacterium CRU_2_2]
MPSASYGRFIEFLQAELGLSSASISMALKRSEQDTGPLHMILWRYGLITLEQLEQIYDWMETAA